MVTEVFLLELFTWKRERGDFVKNSVLCLDFNDAFLVFACIKFHTLMY